MPTIRDYMAREPITLTPDMSIQEARRLLVRNEISGAPVVDERGRLVGILTERDVIGAVIRASYHQDPGSRVVDCMTEGVETLEAETEIEEAAEVFLRSRWRRFPVVSENRMVGLISRGDVLRAVEDLWTTNRPHEGRPGAPRATSDRLVGRAASGRRSRNA